MKELKFHPSKWPSVLILFFSHGGARLSKPGFLFTAFLTYAWFCVHITLMDFVDVSLTRVRLMVHSFGVSLPG